MGLSRAIQKPGVTFGLLCVLLVGGVAFMGSWSRHGPLVVETDIGFRCGTSGVRVSEFGVFGAWDDPSIRLLIGRERYNPEELPGISAMISVGEDGEWSGLFSPTGLTQEIDARVIPVGSETSIASWTAQDDARSVSLLVTWLEAQGEYRAAEMLASGTTTKRRALAIGYLYNVLWLSLVGLTLYSFGWVREVGRGTLAEQRLARGQCPACAYPMDGLPSPVCPECGERVGERFA
ncbi:MAG: hypothetical protein H6812_06540 [Phycisphaeraceae bacterium]|nr:hypothetical protein [Phycisphaerales bacterium]MCB9842902.1 hypothetical protein [Phycisphaeraceae bacterium]